MKHDVIGAVLAGGRGRRVGGDKASLEIGGRTLARRAVDALLQVGLEPLLLLRGRQQAPRDADSIPIVRDEVEDAGPLGGLHALFRGTAAEWALVVACDQPLLDPRLLRGLLAEPRDDVEALVGRPSRPFEPLPGLYRRTSLQTIEKMLAGSERSLHGLLSSLQVRDVPERTLRRWDPELLSYLNVNTPADLARARALAASAGDERQESRRR